MSPLILAAAQAAIDAANAEFRAYEIARGSLPPNEQEPYKNPGRAAVCTATFAAVWLVTAVVDRGEDAFYWRGVLALCWIAIAVGHLREWRRRREAPASDAKPGPART